MIDIEPADLGIPDDCIVEVSSVAGTYSRNRSLALIRDILRGKYDKDEWYTIYIRQVWKHDVSSIESMTVERRLSIKLENGQSLTNEQREALEAVPID